MTVCPVYQSTFREADVARGKLALLESMEKGLVRPSARLDEILSRCLMCGACVQVCANKVQTTRIMQQYRERLFETKKGGAFSGDLLTNAMGGDSSAKALLKGGALLQALVCKKIPESSGLHLRFPWSTFTERQTVPALARSSFLDLWTPSEQNGPEGPRIGFFVGCGANYLFPDAAASLTRITESLGASLVVPQDQVCCGLPAYVAGNTGKARELARKNIRAFESLDLDVVLSVCASCGAHLEKLPSLFKNEPSMASSAASLAKKHMDAMAFLVDHLHVETYLEVFRAHSRSLEDVRPLRVAYHDPCHLRIGQGITRAPRRLLAAVPGLELVEVPHPGRCCGHGGHFNLSHFSASMRVFQRRLKDFEEVKPDYIVTGCTGCLLQFIEGLSGHGQLGRVEVCHPLALVEKTIAPYRIRARRKPNPRPSRSQNTDSALWRSEY